MSPWIARYEEGYETSTGETVTLTDTLHETHPWRDPEHARRHWAMRPDLPHEMGTGSFRALM